MGEKVYKELGKLSALISEEDRVKLDEQEKKEQYQKGWRENKFKHREMVAKKNRKWIKVESENSELDEYEEVPDVYAKIEELFAQESKRKWMLHIITNFIPLNNAEKVTKMPVRKNTCCISGYQLTDVKRILTGDRDKHLAFTGKETNIILSGIALQELYRFVINHTYDFDSQAGHIINFAFDKIRTKNSPKN